MLTTAHTVLLGEDADAQSCVAAALPPVALCRLRRTCCGASGAAPVGVDWAWLRQPSGVAEGEDPDPWDTLYVAAHQGRAAVVAWLLVHLHPTPGALLNVAALASYPEVIHLLTAAGLEHSPYALLLAVQLGNLPLLTAVLGAGVHPDSEGVFSEFVRFGAPMYALAGACESGRFSCARALLAAGADVDKQGGWGASALMEAARMGHLECMRLLLEHSANVHARSSWRGTALMEATRAGRLACVRLLLEHRADVHARDDWGATALNFSKTTHQGDQTACTQALIAAGANVHAANHDGRTALMYAALYGNRSIAPLLEAGADMHAADVNGFTPMLSACRHGVLQTALLLDRHGADRHAVSADGTTAVMLARMKNHGDVVQWLLDKDSSEQILPQ